MAQQIQLRNGTAAEWTSKNPVLMVGEFGVETDTLKIKLGDGSSHWATLPYFTQGVKGDTGATGPANTLSVGSVSTGAAGSPATVTISGTAPNQTISFAIPQGLKGDTGLGIPSGGTAGQVVVRTVDGTAWTDLPPSSLAGQSDVQITSPADKQVLQYEASTSKWKNKAATGGVTVSDPAPSTPIQGDGWFYAADGTLFVRFTDGNGNTTWIQPNAPLAAQVEQRYYSPNYIINGGFDIWQRGVSFSAGGYTADRWTGDFVTGAGTVTQQAFTPGTAPVAGYEGTYFLRRTVTTGAQFSSLIHRVEDVRTLAGQTVTLSFWAKGTNPTGNFTVALIQSFGSGGSADNGTALVPLVLNSTWTRYTSTVTLPSVAGKTIGPNSFLWLSIYQTSANTSSSVLDIWGVQLESGSTATAFRRNANSLQGELAACQRYYWRYGAGTDMYGLATVTWGSTSYGEGLIQFPAPMRAVPSSMEYANIKMARPAVGSYAVTSLYAYITTVSSCFVLMNTATSGAAQGDGSMLLTNGTSGYIGFSAEL